MASNPRHPATTKVWNAAFATLVAVSLFQATGEATMNVLIPLYARELGASASAIGFVTGSFAITSLLARPFVGPAFDSFSRKRMLLAALALMASAIYLYGVAESVTQLALTRMLHGFGVACVAPLMMTLVAETQSAPNSQRFSGLSIFTLTYAFAQCTGPALGLFLSQRLGYQTTFCISSAATLCALTLALRIKETPHRSHIPYRPALQRMFAKEALLPATLSCILTMSHSCVGAFLVMYGQSRGIHEVGLYFTVYAAGLLITRPLFGALADRYGAHRMIFAGLAFFALGFACISQARSFAALMASAAVNALGYGAITPLLQSLSLHATPASRRGAASNTSYAGTDLGYLLGPVAAGTFVDAVRPSISTDAQTYGTLYLFAIVPIAFGAVLLALRWQRLEALMAQNAPLHPPAP